jgi:hypothetical protein
LDYRGRRACARDDGVVGPDIEIPDRVIAGKTLAGAGNIQLVGSSRHIDRRARVQVRERDCTSQAAVVRRSGAGRSGGSIVSSININGGKR